MSELIRLALPVIVSYLGMMAMGIVDLLFIGRVGAAAIGGVGVSTALFTGLLIFGIGLLAGLDYLVSHAYGAGKRDEGFRYYQQGIVLGVVLSIPLTLILYWISWELPSLGIGPEVVVHAAPYLRVLSLSMMPNLLFTATRQYLQAQGVVRPAMVILLVANLINALCNYVFVYGHWGAPAMGTVGSGLATLGSRVFMLLALGAYLYAWDARHHQMLERLRFSFDKKAFMEMVRLGLPSALQMSLEVGVFVGATALAARFPAQDLAAHQIVMNIASTSFMVPLGVSASTAVLVGRAMGARDWTLAARRGYQGLALGLGFMALSCLLLLGFPRFILGLYTNDPSVIEVGREILFLAALFQLADGAQTVASGALRGIADTVTPMLANLCGHWFIGLPVGLYCAFRLHWGVRGLWMGLSAGLISVAVALVARWRVRSRQIQRLETVFSAAPPGGMVP